MGGSAAGLFTAATVAEGGRHVRVLESRRGFEPAARSLIVTDQFRSQLGAVGIRKHRQRNPAIRIVHRWPVGAGSAERGPISSSRRSRLIPALARKAQQAGATLSFDTRFLGLAANGHGLRV